MIHKDLFSMYYFAVSFLPLAFDFALDLVIGFTLPFGIF
jgi:hypothetical protein